MSAQDLMFANGTDVSANVYTSQQVEHLITQQFGFWIDVNSIGKDFYKIAVQDETGNNVDDQVVIDYTSLDVSGTMIHDALRQTTIGYLNDAAGDEVIGTDVYSASTLTNEDHLGASSNPGDTLRVGEHILNGVIGAAFSGNYGSYPVEPSNMDKLVKDANVAYGQQTESLDDKIAAGFDATLSVQDSGADKPHTELFRTLLDKLRDASQNDVQVVKTNFTDLSYNVAHPILAGHKLWMKLNLTIDLNEAENADYINIQGIDTDDGSGVDLVTQSYKGDQAGFKMTLADLHSTWKDKAKATVVLEDGSSLTGASVASSTSQSPIDYMTVPILFRFNVSA